MNIPYLNCNDTKLLLQVKKDLARHEGFREFAYADPLTPLYKKYAKLGKWGYAPARTFLSEADLKKPETGAPWTYGYGFTKGVNVDSRIDRIKADRLLEEHILEMDAVLKNLLYWFTDASFVTRVVLINMAFNLGVKGLLKFRNSLAFIKAKDYPKAATNLKLSLWYKQVGARAVELVERIKTQTIAPQHAAPEKV